MFVCGGEDRGNEAWVIVQKHIKKEEKGGDKGDFTREFCKFAIVPSVKMERHIKKAFIALCSLALRNSLLFKIQPKGRATIDAHVICIYSAP